MDTVDFLPMCHHYILLPENSTIQAGDPLYSIENIYLNLALVIISTKQAIKLIS